MPQHKKLSILPLRLPPTPKDVPPSLRQYLEQLHNALESGKNAQAAIDLCSGLTKFSDAVNAGYFLGFTRNDDGYDDGIPVFVVGDRDAAKYFEFDGADLSLGRETQLLGSDAYNNNSIYWHSYFDSLDAIDTSSTSGGTVSLGSGGVLLSVGTATDRAAVRRIIHHPIIQGSWSASRRFKTKVTFDSGIDFTDIYWQVSQNAISRQGSGNSDFGFYGNGTAALVGFSRNGSSETTLSLGVNLSANTSYTFEAVLTAGEKVEFYSDGTKLGEITTNLPASGSADGVCGVYLEVTSSPSSNQNIRFGEWRFLQEP